MSNNCFNLPLLKYAKHRGVSITAIQRAIKENRLTENRSYIITGNSKIKPRYKINQVEADVEWSETTTINGNNIHSISSNSEIEKIKKDPIINKTTDQKKQSIPSIAQSKAVAEYYNAQLKKVKLEKEKKTLVEYDLVEYIFKNMILKFKQRQLQIPSKLKLLIGKENADIVKEEIMNSLEELSTITMDDFEGEV